MELIWLQEAQDDFERVFNFLLSANANAALKLIDQIEQASSLLKEHPFIGALMQVKVGDDDTKRRELFIPFGAGAYVIRYRVIAERIIIVRVWHSRELRT